MKLKNKLLPLVGLGAACAAVTPIALTSCNTSDLVDLTQKYAAKITDIPGQDSWTKSKTNSTYFAACAANPEIFIDDCYWSTSYINNLAESSAYNILADNEKISNISFKSFGSETELVGKFWTVSFERTIDFEIETEGSLSESNRDSDIINTDVKGATIKYANVPIVVEYDSDAGLWLTRVAINDESEMAYWTYLWDQSVDTSVTLNVDFHNVVTVTSTSGYQPKIHTYKSYNLEIKDIPTITDFITLLADDDEYLQPFYELRIANFGYSHYLFNISYIKE